jgi:hypothetical protein
MAVGQTEAEGGKAMPARAERAPRTRYGRSNEGKPLFLELVKVLSEAFGFLRIIGYLSDQRSDKVLQLDALFERIAL